MSKKITSIQINKNTLEELKSLKIIKRETYDSVINRLIFLPRSIIKISEILNGLMQPIINGKFEEYEKEIRGDLVKILDLISFLYEKRLIEEYRGEYFSTENLKKDIEKRKK